MASSTSGGFALPGGVSVTYADLVDDTEQTLLPLDPGDDVELFSQRPLAQRQSVGRVREPVHIDRLVTGAEVYSRDVRLPGLAFGEAAQG